MKRKLEEVNLEEPPLKKILRKHEERQEKFEEVVARKLSFVLSENKMLNSQVSQLKKAFNEMESMMLIYHKRIHFLENYLDNFQRSNSRTNSCAKEYKFA